MPGSKVLSLVFGIVGELAPLPFSPFPRPPGRKASRLRVGHAPSIWRLCSGYFHSLGNAPSKLEAAQGPCSQPCPKTESGASPPHKLCHTHLGLPKCIFLVVIPACVYTGALRSSGKGYDDFVESQRREAVSTFQWEVVSERVLMEDVPVAWTGWMSRM